MAVIQRKIIAAFFTTIFAVVGLIIAFTMSISDGELMLGILVYSSFSAPIIFIYGITTSIISDNLSTKAKMFRKTLSFFIHMVFGIGFIFPFSIIEPVFLEDGLLNVVTVGGLFCSVIFYCIDFVLEKHF